MLTYEEIKIAELFRNNLFNDYTIMDLMRKISKKSYNWVFHAVKKLEKSGIISIKKKGNSKICSINLDNHLTLTYFSLLEELALISKKIPKDIISELIKAIPLSYFTLIIAGSYAKGKAKKDSDLDIVVLVEEKENIKKVFTILKNKGELMIPVLHPYVFTKKEFIQMLLNEEENYGKMIFKNRLIAFGAENYYLIIQEAIKGGFKG